MCCWYMVTVNCSLKPLIVLLSKVEWTANRWPQRMALLMSYSRIPVWFHNMHSICVGFHFMIVCQSVLCVVTISLLHVTCSFVLVNQFFRVYQWDKYPHSIFTYPIWYCKLGTAKTMLHITISSPQNYYSAEQESYFRDLNFSAIFSCFVCNSF